MRAANGTWYPAPSGIFCCGDTPPVQTWMAAQPRAFSACANATLLSRSQPPSTQSVADRRTHTGRSAGNAARTASNTSSGKRMRFSRLPPYSSVRWLASGDRNSCSR